MWSSSFCLLSVVIAISAEQSEGSPILNAPTNLEVLNKSNDSVLFAWNFERPINVSLPEIEFIVLLESRGKPKRGFRRHFSDAPFNMTLKGLSPQSTYTVRIRAGRPKWRDSKTVRISFSFPVGAFPVLKSPTNLRVGKGNDTWAVFAWDFDKPDNVSLSDVEFHLRLESATGSKRYSAPRFIFPPFNYSFYGLSPKTTYTVEIQASTAGWQDSPTADVSFTTPKIDWPTPFITDVQSKPGEQIVHVTVNWYLGTLPHWLKHFKFEVCNARCHQITEGSLSTSATVSIKYDTQFTIRVIAVYDLPVIGRITRPSEPYSARTSTGFIGKGTRPPNPEQRDNYVHLMWLPFYAPHGPTPYYEVLVCEKNSTSEAMKQVSQDDQTDISTKSEKNSPFMPGTVFELTVGGDSFSTGNYDVSGFDQCLAPKPLQLVVIKRLERSVRFRIVFPEASSSRYIAGLESLDLRIGSNVAAVFDLAPYTVHSILIRSCLTHRKRSIDVCGNYSYFEIRSNVAGPSRVRNLRMHPLDSENQPRITWEAPENPSGPIGGFKISVRSKPLWRLSEKIYWVKPDARTFVLENFNPIKTYEIGVAAFNLDLEVPTELVFGEWNRITVVPEDSGFYLNHGFYFAISLAFIGLCMCCIGCAHDELNGVRREEEEIRRRLAFENSRPPRYAPLIPMRDLRRHLGPESPSGSLSPPSDDAAPPPAYDDVFGHSSEDDSSGTLRLRPATTDLSPPPSPPSPPPAIPGSSPQPKLKPYGQVSGYRRPIGLTIPPSDSSEPCSPSSESTPSGELIQILPPGGLASPQSEARASGYLASLSSENSRSTKRGTDSESSPPYSLRSDSKKLLDISELTSDGPGYVASQSSESLGSGFSAAVPCTQRDGSLPDVRSSSSIDDVPSPKSGFRPPPPSVASEFAQPLPFAVFEIRLPGSDPDSDGTVQDGSSIPTDSIAGQELAPPSPSSSAAGGSAMPPISSTAVSSQERQGDSEAPPAPTIRLVNQNQNRSGARKKRK